MLQKGSFTSSRMVRGRYPAGDPIANTEWKAKPPVNEKADLLQVEEADLLRVEQVGRIPA